MFILILDFYSLQTPSLNQGLCHSQNNADNDNNDRLIFWLKFRADIF